MTDRISLNAMTSDQLDALYYRLDQARNAAHLHRQGLITTAELYAVIEAGPTPDPAATQATEPDAEPADDEAGYAMPDPPIGCITLAEAEPAHNAGPSIAEATADDRAWPLQRNGE